MPLVTTTEMFKKAYEGGYAIGAFNVNNMEIVQGITEAAAEEKSPIILQASAGARKYASGSRRRLRNLQVLHRRRIHFRYDRRFLQALRREYRSCKAGC